MSDENARSARARLARFLSPPLQVLLVLVALTILGLSFEKPSRAESTALTLVMSAETSTAGQVFPVTPDGYTEAAAKKFDLIADGARHTYVIPLDRVPEKVRIDPGSAPGLVRIHEVSLASDGDILTLKGASLDQKLHPANQMERIAADGDGVTLRATADDPYMEITGIAPAHAGDFLAQVLRLAMRAAALGLIGVIAYANRRRLLTAGSLLAQRWPIVSVLAFCVATLVVLQLLGLGCATNACSPRGFGYGSLLAVASLGFALVSTAFFYFVSRIRHCSRMRGGLFFHVLVGQVLLVAYIYARSFVHALMPFLPVTRAELIAVPIVATIAWAIARRRESAAAIAAGATSNGMRLLLQVAILGLVCVVVADRELPRLVMLSSDPDSHVFFATQMDRFGGIYRDQGDWGTEGLTYPFGSAALIHAWASLTFMGAGNTLAALPLLLTLFAALAIAERFVRRGTGIQGIALAALVAIGVVAAAFAFPVYQRFAHLEGAGRQVSIACEALVAIFCCAVFGAPRERRAMVERALVVPAILTLFVLAVLNPINLVLASILFSAHAVTVLLFERRLSWLLLPPVVAPLLMLLDPYYFNLAFGAAPPPKITLVGAFRHLQLREILGGWIGGLSQSPRPFVESFLKLLPEQGAYSFALIAGGLALGLLPSGGEGRSFLRGFVMTMFVLLCVYAASALLQATSGDSRLYLLSAYFPYSLAQYKGLVVTAMAVALVVRIHSASTAYALTKSVAAFGLIVGTAYLAVRPYQPMLLAPRHDYCGSIGCARESDVRVVSRLEDMVRDGRIRPEQGGLPRVLIPNALVNTGIEKWVFPTGASRYLAVADALPLAFYYYQGDVDYTTTSYEAHVCNTLDRAWLNRERIRFIFLPADRAGACLATMDQLRYSDTVVLQDGDTFLIRLREP